MHRDHELAFPNRQRDASDGGTAGWTDLRRKAIVHLGSTDRPKVVALVGTLQATARARRRLTADLFGQLPLATVGHSLSPQ